MIEKIVKKKLSEAMEKLPPCNRGEQHKLVAKTEPKSMIIEVSCHKCGFKRKLIVGKIEDSNR